jgi:hypothetical protein
MRLGALAVLVAVFAACTSAAIGPVTIQTSAPAPVCAAARVSGSLVADPVYGLAFKSDGGVRGVVWPNGYSARRGKDGVVVLIDPSGRTVAREGDTIVSAGAWSDDDIAFPCGELEVNPPTD